MKIVSVLLSLTQNSHYVENAHVNLYYNLSMRQIEVTGRPKQKCRRIIYSSESEDEAQNICNEVLN